MNEDKPNKKKRIKTLESIVIVLCVGVIQGGICGIIGLLMALLNDYAIFSVVIIWLVFGWLSTYLIKIKTLDILITIISGSITSFLVLFFSGLSAWFVSIIIGVSMIFWGISFVTKIMLFPRTKTDEVLKENLNQK